MGVGRLRERTAPSDRIRDFGWAEPGPRLKRISPEVAGLQEPGGNQSPSARVKLVTNGSQW